MREAIFGGTFDPPHLGHEQVAKSLIENGIVDEVWFVPVFEHPWANIYQKEISAYEDRVAMLEIITAGSPGLKVAHFKDVSFTYNTLQYFSQKHPANTFFWVMGSEYLAKFADFLADHPRLMEYPFLIYPRAGYDMEPSYGNMLLLEEMPAVEISSTEVRQAVKNNESLHELVSSEVAEYILAKALYQNLL